MKLPIILNASHSFDVGGDVDIYNSVEALSSYIEVVDVLNDEFIAYDSAGYILKLEVYDDPNRKGRSIRISEPETPIQMADALRNILIEYLDFVIERRRTRGKGCWESILALLGKTFPEEVKDREISKERLNAATLEDLISIAFELGIVRG